MSRRLLAISAVLATLGAFSAPASAADAAKPDVHGLYLMTDYPAISVQAGTTSTVSLHLRNYGLPPQRLALDQVVEPHAEYSRHDLKKAETAASFPDPQVGSQRLRFLAGRLTAPIVFSDERGRKTFFVLSSRDVAG